VDDPDRKIELKSTNLKKSISEETRLVLTGGPFSTYDEAELSGKRAK